MKKSLFAIGLTLSMALTLSVPAFATNTNADGTEVTKPGTPGSTQEAGASYNAANMTSADGTTWATVNDDDALAGANDANGADINVWAKVVDTNTRVYKVDLAWGAMKFEYKNTDGTWNPATHTYTEQTGQKGWTETALIDGTNNKVAITNHSNNAINADFAYKMEGTKFNEANGVNNVIGNFFDANAKAVTAAKVLTATYTDTNGTVNAATVADKLAAPVKLATADAYNSSATTPTDASANQTAAARTDDVFFAFSGTPDAGKGKTLDTFKKVGVITVTVTPNNDEVLNRPIWTATAP